MKKTEQKTWETGVGESPESQFHVFPVFIQVGPKKTGTQLGERIGHGGWIIGPKLTQLACLLSFASLFRGYPLDFEYITSTSS